MGEIGVLVVGESGDGRRLSLLQGHRRVEKAVEPSHQMSITVRAHCRIKMATGAKPQDEDGCRGPAPLGERGSRNRTTQYEA